MSTTINPYSKLGYLALKRESSENTAVKPDKYIELLEESIIVNWNQVVVNPIAGSLEMNQRTANDKVSVSGTITIPIEPRTVGHLLSNFFGLPTTTVLQAGKVWEHVFTPSELPDTYTMDIRPAGDSYVNRYVGVKISQLEISQSDNKMQLTLTITAQKAFTSARITTATVSATRIHVDQTGGLTASDVVEVRDADDYSTVNHTASVSTFSSETVITLASAITASVGDIMTIRRSTVSYSLSNDMIWIGGAVYSDGRDINNAETVNDTEDATYTFKRDSEERHSASGINVVNRFPTKILLKGLSSEGSFQHYYASPKYSERTRRGQKSGLRTKIYGKAIDTNSAQAAVASFGTGNGKVLMTASVASETSNNLNVTVITNTVDTLAATKSGYDITVKLASTTTASNTATLVAAAINALSGVTSAAGGTGANTVTTQTKLNFGSGTFRRGRDANEKELLRIDFPHAKFQPFGANISQDNLVQEEINFIGVQDTVSGASTKILLRNNISTYS